MEGKWGDYAAQVSAALQAPFSFEYTLQRCTISQDFWKSRISLSYSRYLDAIYEHIAHKPLEKYSNVNSTIELANGEFLTSLIPANRQEYPPLWLSGQKKCHRVFGSFIDRMIMAASGSCGGNNLRARRSFRTKINNIKKKSSTKFVGLIDCLI